MTRFLVAQRRHQRAGLVTSGSYAAAVVVKARLDGHDFDLRILAELFRDGDPIVSSDGEGHYIASSSFDDLLSDGGQLWDVAEVVLRRANGVARSLGDGFRPARLVGRFSGDDGSQHVVIRPDSVLIRTRAETVTLVVNGEVQRPPASPAPGYLRVAETQPDVGEVLDLLGKEVVGLDWFDLYKVYEIIRGNVGGEASLFAKNWVPAAELKAFTASANHPGVSGNDARHARGPAGMPQHTMTLEQGRGTVNLLVVAWLDSL